MVIYEIVGGLVVIALILFGIIKVLEIVERRNPKPPQE